MKAVAVSSVLNQAVADLSADVDAFLREIHQGTVGDVHASAEHYSRKLRELVRSTGVVLDDLPAWKANITGWRAIARLAHPVVETTQAG